MAAWVYILECADGLYYVGSHRGEHPSTREAAHNAGVDPKAFTFRRRPVRLVWAWKARGSNLAPSAAIAFERRLEGWSRAKKQAVIEGRWSDLPELSRSPKDASTSSA